MASGAFRIQIEMKDKSFKRMRAPVHYSDLLKLMSRVHDKPMNTLCISSPADDHVSVISSQEDYNAARESIGTHGLLISINKSGFKKSSRNQHELKPKSPVSRKSSYKQLSVPKKRTSKKLPDPKKFDKSSSLKIDALGSPKKFSKNASPANSDRQSPVPQKKAPQASSPVSRKNSDPLSRRNSDKKSPVSRKNSDLLSRRNSDKKSPVSRKNSDPISRRNSDKKSPVSRKNSAQSSPDLRTKFENKSILPQKRPNQSSPLPKKRINSSPKSNIKHLHEKPIYNSPVSILNSPNASIDLSNSFSNLQFQPNSLLIPDAFDKLEVDPSFYSDSYPLIGLKSAGSIELIDPISAKKEEINCFQVQMSSRFILLDKYNIMFTGGVNSLIHVFKVNIPTKEVTNLPFLRIGRFWHAMCLLEGRNPMVIGGCAMNNNSKESMSSVEMFDEMTPRWKDMPALINKRSNPTVCNLNQHIFVIGGVQYLQGPAFFLNNIEKWSGQKWEMVCTMTLDTQGMAAVPINSSSVLIMGGGHSQNSLAGQVYKWDCQGNTFTPQKPLIQPSKFTYKQFSVQSDKIRLIGTNSEIINYYY